MPDDLSAWIDRLPHGGAFRFVSRLDALAPGESARGAWLVTPDDPRLAGHFPNRPVVPGVLIAEALGQIAGLAAFADEGEQGGMLAHVDVRFKHAVEPPAEIELHATVTRRMGPLAQCDVTASADSVTVARGSLTLARGGGG